MSSALNAKTGFGFVVIASVLFGTTGTAQQFVSLDVSGLYIGAARQVVGGVALLLLVLLMGQRAIWPLFVSRAGLFAAAGTLIYQLTFFVGIQTNGISVGTVVALGSAPVFTAVLSKFALKEQIKNFQILIFVIVAIGIWLLLVGFDGHLELSWSILTSLAAGVGYAMYTVNAKLMVSKGVDSTTALAIAFAGAAPAAALILILGQWQWLLAGSALLLVLYLGLLPTALAYFFFGKGLAVLPAATVATITLLEPAVATLLAVVIIGESLQVVEILGIGLVILGLLLLARFENQQK